MTGSIYIHVPFCKKKCHYCSFYVIRSRQSGFELYTKTLIQEIRQNKGVFSKIDSIYFGGGTPTQLPMPYFRQIMQELEPTGEVTLEANPQDLTKESLQEYKRLGINRLSIGAQTFNTSELITLGRGHSSSQTEIAIQNAREAGFENISIDLMVDLPNQTIASVEHTLKSIASLSIEHISLYNLQIEKNSLFYAIKQALILPDDELSFQIYNKMIDGVQALGFDRYEISAFCKKGYEAKHNSRYWKGLEFIGLGPSAFSYRKKRRYQNAKSLHRWARAVESDSSAVEFSEELDSQASVKERLAIALRLTEGVELKNWSLEEETLNQIETLISKGLLKKSNGILKLDRKGLLFYDTVAQELI